MTPSKRSTVKTAMHPTLQMFEHAFSQLSRNRRSLSSQLKKAESDYPLVVLTLKLTTIYARFVQRFYADRWRRKASDKPVPDGGGEAIITWPPDLEPKDIFQQLKEWSDALIEAGAEYERDTRTEIRACPIIRQDYRGATTCIQRYIENPPQTDEEWNEYINCIEKLSLYASEMRSHNCSF
jgi:hypothetical protein